MIGSLLAGTDESPGSFIHRDGVRYKMIRGMASYGASLGREKRTGNQINNSTPEGVEGLIPYRGSTEEVISQLCGGIRSGLSYSGAKNIEELWENSLFLKISNSGLIESRHHDINKV
jgi:IMP dehydrogenase